MTNRHTPSSPPYRTLFDDLITNNVALTPDTTPTPITINTRAVELDVRLGTCNAREDFIEEHRHLDLRLTEAKVRQAESEADRYEHRLNATPPLLNPPTPCCDGQANIRVSIDTQPPAEPAP